MYSRQTSIAWAPISHLTAYDDNSHPFEFCWTACKAPPSSCAFDGSPLYGMARPSPPPSPGRRLEGEMDIHVLGIDLGKNSCSVVGLDPTGRVVLRRRMRRE